MSDDLRKLKDEAAKAVEKGKPRRAAELYDKIADRDLDPLWPHRAGEAYKRAGMYDEAMPRLAQAAQGYASQGFLLKAVAVCKMILEIDPRHRATQTMLASLYSRRDGRPSEPAATAPAGPPPEVAVAAEPGEANRLVTQPFAGGGTGAAPSSLRPPPPRVPPPVVPKVPRIEAPTQFAPSDGTSFDLSGPVEEIPELDLDLEEDVTAAAPPPDQEPMDSLQLAQVIPAAHQSGEFPAVEIPLDDIYDDEPSTPSLPRIPLFSSLSAEALRRLIERVARQEVAAGAAVVRQGEPSQGELFVTVRGAAAVTVRVDGIDREIGHIGEGDFFGEMSLITNFRRSATVTASSPMELLVVDRAMVHELINEDRTILTTLLRFFRERLIRRLVATSRMFESLVDEDASEIASRFAFLEFEPGAVLIENGKRSPGLVVILCGSCDIVMPGETTPVALLGPGEICGELSLLKNVPATGTVRARTRVWALVMSRAQFQEVAVTHPGVLIYVNDVADQRRQKISNLDLI